MWLTENKDNLRTIICKILIAKCNKPDWNESYLNTHVLATTPNRPCLVPRRLSFDENARKGMREGDNPSHGPLLLITSHSFRARPCHAKNEAPEEEAETDQFPVADGSTTAMWWARACAILHKSWHHVRLKLPSPRKRLHLKFPTIPEEKWRTTRSLSFL